MATAKKTSRATSRKGGAGAKKKAQASGATQEIIGFALMVLGIFSFVAVVMGGAGLLGESIAGVMFGLFGLGAYVVPLLLLCIGWSCSNAKRMRLHPGKLALDERDGAHALCHQPPGGGWPRAADRARDAGERGLLGLHRRLLRLWIRPTTSAPARWGES